MNDDRQQRGKMKYKKIPFDENLIFFPMFIILFANQTKRTPKHKLIVKENHR